LETAGLVAVNCFYQYEIGNYTYLSWLSSDYGVAQKMAGHGVKSTARAVQEMISFMSSFGKTDLSLSPCQNRDKLCCFWASSGECYRGDTDYMQQSCVPCFKSCLAEDFKIDLKECVISGLLSVNGLKVLHIQVADGLALEEMLPVAVGRVDGLALEEVAPMAFGRVDGLALEEVVPVAFGRVDGLAVEETLP
jgi:hypothetical protein